MSEFSVRAYGAHGDGVTNDTTFIQNAITAAEAVQGTVIFPRGSYVMGNVTVSNNVTIRGEGVGSSIILPASSSITLFSCVPVSSGYYNLTISDLQFNTVGQTGVTAISVAPGASNLYPYNGWLRNLLFNNIAIAIKLDQARMFKLTDIQLWGQSTIWIGSTIDTGPDPYAHRVSLSGIHHYPAGATLSGALITLQRAVAITVVNLASMGLGGTMDAIDIINDCQGVNITNMDIEGALNGVKCFNTTVGSTTVYPQDITLSNSSIDAFWTTGFDGSGAFTVNIIGNHFSNFNTHGSFAYAIHQGGDDYVINDNLLWISAGAVNGNGITMDGSSQGSQINNNSFSTMQLGSGNCIVIASGSDYYEVQGNTSRNRISGGFILDLASGAHRSVQSTASWPN